jgi:hypothetical protein
VFLRLAYLVGGALEAVELLMEAIDACVCVCVCVTGGGAVRAGGAVNGGG